MTAVRMRRRAGPYPATAGARLPDARAPPVVAALRIPQHALITGASRQFWQVETCYAAPDDATGALDLLSLNQTELGRDVGLPQPTVHRWLNLLETSYLLVRLPAYAANRTKRLAKSPRIFWGDTGVVLHLGSSAPAGAHLENLVLDDLLAWGDARVERAELAYWRTTIGEEVDFVIEAGGKLLPIEVKATSKPRLADCTHLGAFRQEYGRKARAGLLLHTERAVEWLTPDVLAVPW